MIFETKATAFAAKNDGLRNAFAVTGTRCFLLNRTENSQVFESNGELVAGYRVRFDDNRSESGLFRYAYPTLSFRDTWAKSTHIGYGVPESSKVEVYKFVEGEKDTIDPDGASVYWSARVVKVPNERYTIV